MTARQLYEGVLIELNKENAPNILLEDFNYFANKAVNNYVNKRYNIYDINQQTTDDLRVLKATAMLKPKQITDYSGLTMAGDSRMATYEVVMPTDYLHILNCICIYRVNKTYKCYNRGDTWRSPATRLTADMYSLVLDNFWNKPTYKRPYYYIHNVNTSNTIPTNPYGVRTFNLELGNKVYPLRTKQFYKIGDDTALFYYCELNRKLYYFNQVTSLSNVTLSKVYCYESAEQTLLDNEAAHNIPEYCTPASILINIDNRIVTITNLNLKEELPEFDPLNITVNSIPNITSKNNLLYPVDLNTLDESVDVLLSLGTDSARVSSKDGLQHSSFQKSESDKDYGTDGWDHDIVQGEGLPRTIEIYDEDGHHTISNVERGQALRYGNVSLVRLEIRYGTDTSVFELTDVYVDYIKAPQNIRLTQKEIDLTEDTSLMLEYPDYVCQEIINELVHLVMENISDLRLQTHPVVTLSIANPAQALAPQAQGLSAQ